jgi:hypothetical protein
MSRLLALLACVIMGCEPVAVVVDYDYSEVYTTTVTRAVGPTTLTGARGTLPQPAPDDTNSVWVAMNGSDANAGTQASPKLTIAGASGAISALGGAKTNIHIFRNGIVGALSIAVGGTTQLPDNDTLQVEDGETCLLTGQTLFVGSNTNVNGVELDAGFGIQQSTGETGAQINNCKVPLLSTASSTTASITANYSVIKRIVFSAVGGTSQTYTINATNCILVLSPSGGDRTPIQFTGTSNANTYTANVTRCLTYSSFVTGIGLEYFAGSLLLFSESRASGSASTLNLNIASSAISTNGYTVVGANTTGSTVVNTVNIVADYSVIAVPSAFTQTDDTELPITQTWTVNQTYTNALPAATPFLLVAPISYGIYSDAGTARLQAIGKTTPDGLGTYFINSPLVDAGISGVDVNPWDETISGPVRTYNKQMTLNTYPQALQVPDELTGAVEVANLNGGSERDYDGVQQKWMLDWNKDNCPTQIVVKQLKALQRDRGTQKWYLGDLAGDFGFSDVASSGTVAGIDSDRFTVTLIAPEVDLVENNWANKWMVFDMGSAPAEEFWIESNDNSDELILVDKLGIGIPANGVYNISVPYLLGNLSLDSITALQQRLQVDMRKGSTYAEVESAPDTHPWTGGNVILIEQTDPKPNI